MLMPWHSLRPLLGCQMLSGMLGPETGAWAVLVFEKSVAHGRKDMHKHAFASLHNTL